MDGIYMHIVLMDGIYMHIVLSDKKDRLVRKKMFS